MSWSNININQSIHVVPHADIHQHDLSADGKCICGPKIERFDSLTSINYSEPLIIHNAFDGREFNE